LGVSFQNPTLDGIAVGVARGVVGASVVAKVSCAVVAPVIVRGWTVVTAVVRMTVVVRIGVAVTVVRPIIVVATTVAWQGRVVGTVV